MQILTSNYGLAGKGPYDEASERNAAIADELLVHALEGFKVLPVLQVLKTGGLGRLRVQPTPLQALNIESVRSR